MRSMWRNSESSFGLIQILLHWVTTFAVVGMFALGLVMVELGYYDPWYHRAPAIHKSVGLLLCGLLVIRVAWRLASSQPLPLGERWLKSTAQCMHLLLYFVLFALLLSGYLIASADGRPVRVFDWFAVPALTLPLKDQEELAGDIHAVAAWTLIVLAALHATVALIHHFINRDASLRRMLWPRTAKHLNDWRK